MDIKPTRQNLDNGLEPNRPLKEQVDAAQRNASDSDSATTTDTVTVTDTAARIRQLEASLSSLPDVDSARVQAIRQAIADGSYQVDADRIATKLLKLEQDLL